MGARRVDKQKKTAAELEDIVKQRIGAGDFRVTIHRDPDTDWHATVYGRQPAEVIAARSWPTRSLPSCASITSWTNKPARPVFARFLNP
jgi:hypothetical protein